MKDIRVLKEALPYLRRHRRQTMVIKLGGELAANPEVLASLAGDISLLTHVNIRIVIVHGGGPQASAMSRRLGLEPKMVQGRRVTDEATLDVAKMVFAGRINVDILSALRNQGVRAVGLSGVDGDILSAKRRPPTEMTDEDTGEKAVVDFGHVGDITHCDTSLLRLLVENGYVPVVSSLAADEEGKALNINADTVASILARDLGATKLITLTSVPGLLRDAKDETTLIGHLTLSEAQAAIESGVVRGGMTPKITSLMAAVQGGVEGAVILSGVSESQLLLELFTNEGVGTLITADDAGSPA